MNNATERSLTSHAYVDKQKCASRVYCDVSVNVQKWLKQCNGNVATYATLIFLLVDVCMLRLQTFRRIVHCRREASMAAVWDLPNDYWLFLNPVEKKRRRKFAPYHNYQLHLLSTNYCAMCDMFYQLTCQVHIQNFHSTLREVFGMRHEVLKWHDIPIIYAIVNNSAKSFLCTLI